PRYAIESACYRGKCGNLITERTGDTIGHATTKRIASDVNAVRINAVIVLEIAYEVACELYVVGITGWAECSHSGIPGGWVIDTLRENQNKSSSVCFNTHICTLCCTQRCILIAMIINHQRLWLITVGWGKVNNESTTESARV